MLLNKANRSYSAFSLIELLVVIAIIAVLTGIAIPIYKRNAQRARIGAAFVLAELVKKDIETYYSKNGRFPQSASEAKYDHFYNGPVVYEVLYYGCTQSNAHQFVITIQSSVVGAGNGNAIDFVVIENNGTLKWYCRKTNGTPISPELLPANCMTNNSLNSVCNNPSEDPIIVDP
jgi:type IV pilus assembly protein PilA